MPFRGFQFHARDAVYAIGILSSILITLAAVWLIARDRQIAVENAELHLDNFAIVLAEQTRIRLGNADPALVSAVISMSSVPLLQEVPAARIRAFFENLYGGLAQAYPGRVLVFHQDARLVAAVPDDADAVGRSFSAHPLFARPLTAESGAIEAPSVLHADQQRLIAYRKVKGYPLLVAISSPLAEVLASWWRNAAVVAAAALLLGTLLLAATLLLGRALRTSSRLARNVSESEMRLNSIIASAMDAIITVDENQNIVLFNAAAERIFRCPAADAVGSSLDRFIPVQYRERHRAHVSRFGEAGVTTRRMGAQMVLAGLRASGEEFPLDASISHATVEGRRFYTVILRDVTERQLALTEQRRVQRQLEDSEQRLQSIIGSAMDAIITVDGQQKIVLFNAAAERIFGCAAREALGSALDRFIPERYRLRHHEHMRKFGEAGVTMRRMGGNLVLSGLRTSGEEFPIDASISHVTVAGEKFFTVILRDITERQRSAQALARSHEELREMYEAMHAVREAERTRIARELHDELGQLLTALKMDATWISARLPKEDALVPKAERMKRVIDNTVAAMRRLAADLRPVMLDDLGLVPAIENLLHDLGDRTGIEVSLDAEEDGYRIREPLASAVYRMVQEALTNVARHAGATRVEARIRAGDGRLRIVVQDDGRGLNPDPERKSYGLIGIRERARTLGGSARIYSPPQGGTIVEIDMPFQPDMASASSANASP